MMRTAAEHRHSDAPRNETGCISKPQKQGPAEIMHGGGVSRGTGWGQGEPVASPGSFALNSIFSSVIECC